MLAPESQCNCGGNGYECCEASQRWWHYQSGAAARGARAALGIPRDARRGSGSRAGIAKWKKVITDAKVPLIGG
jgi:hypothetical protein